MLKSILNYKPSKGQIARPVAFVLALAFFMVSPAQATPITYGALSYDADVSTIVIEDSLNNLEWLRWDTLAGLTYAGTVAAIDVGGQYEGWQIADNAYALMFTDALFSPDSHSCGLTGNVGCANTDLGLTSLLGDNYSAEIDIAWFLSDQPGTEVGSLVYASFNGLFLDYNAWGSIAGADGIGTASWLLYRDFGCHQGENGGPCNPEDWRSIPEPGTLILLALGLIGLGLRRRGHGKVA